MTNWPDSFRRGALLGVWGLVLALCLWIYWPGLAGPSLLDDGLNLTALETLEDSPFLLESVVLGNNSGPLGRPLSMLSFALEKLYLDDGVRGSKWVNLCLHLLTASVLLLFSRDLFRRLQYPAPLLGGLAVASLWLLAPLLLSTVLYSVQRMAQLATLFALVCLWCYLRSRSAQGVRVAAWMIACALALVCGVLSKENALLAVPLIMLLEWKLLRYRASSEQATRRLRLAHGGMFTAGVLLVLAVVLFAPGIILGGYAFRDFSLVERLLTEARILWAYVGQLLWVEQAQLGIYHDDQILSRNLLDPLLTLPAVLGWVAVAVLIVLPRRSAEGATVAFGLGFFVVAHAMESSVFALELYFEHRNYLPAMGLFIAAVGCGYWLLKRWYWLKNWLLLLLILVCGRNVLVIASESLIWSDPHLMHFVALNRFPDSVRTNSEMARTLALVGEIDHALVYSRRVVELDAEGELRHQLRALVLHCLAQPAIPSREIEALSATAADFRDDNVSEKVYILVKEVVDGRCPQTRVEQLADRLKELTAVAQAAQVSPKVYLSLAILENHIERYDRALEYTNALLQRSPGQSQALLMKLYFGSLLGISEAREESLAELIEQRDAGKLSQEQEYNMSLFMDPAESDGEWGAVTGDL